MSNVDFEHEVIKINDQVLSNKGWKKSYLYDGFCIPNDIIKTNTLNTLKGAELKNVWLGGGV